jgi:hypothetical protein
LYVAAQQSGDFRELARLLELLSKTGVRAIAPFLVQYEQFRFRVLLHGKKLSRTGNTRWRTSNLVFLSEGMTWSVRKRFEKRNKT